MGTLNSNVYTIKFKKNIGARIATCTDFSINQSKKSLLTKIIN